MTESQIRKAMEENPTLNSTELAQKLAGGWGNLDRKIYNDVMQKLNKIKSSGRIIYAHAITDDEMMIENTLDTIDTTIKLLQGIRNCSVENGDIHDHYDCRQDLKVVVAKLNELLNKTEA